jgi:hypothetical protein
VSALATGVQQREAKIREEYVSLAEAVPGSILSLRARAKALENLSERYPLSHGGFRAERELHDLRLELTRLEELEEHQKRQVEDAKAQALSEAEAHVVKALARAEAGDLVMARTHFAKALEVDLPDWERRAEVERDLMAVEAELARAKNGEPIEGER